MTRTMETLTALRETEFSEDDIRRVVVPNKVYEIKLEEKLHYYGIMKAPYLATAGFEFLESYIDNLSLVTPDDINRIIREYFTEPEYVACALVSEEEMNKCDR